MFTFLLIGNSNVGKTSFFNRLTKTNLAIDNKINNFTYDFNYGIFAYKNKYSICIDTLNIYDMNIFKKNNCQCIKKYCICKNFIYIIKNINIVCLLIDYNVGINKNDVFLSKIFLKVFKKKIVLLINKIDLCHDNDFNSYNYRYLGIDLIYPISVLNGQGISYFLDDIFFQKKILFKNQNSFYKKIIYFCINLDKYNFILKKIFNKLYCINYIKIVILGKPNVGKSTFMNFIVGNYRSIVSSKSGTTKDFITCFANINNINYIISDSPGLNKFTEKFYLKDKYFFLKKIFEFKIIFYLVDINIGLTKYDLIILNFFLKYGKIIILIFNKCELYSKLDLIKYKRYIVSKYNFISYLDVYFISLFNLKNKELLILFKKLIYNYKNIFSNKFTSCRLTKFLKKSINKFYGVNKKIVKLKYAHIGGYYPFTIVIHGKKNYLLNSSYKKYLINFYIKKLNLKGCKIFLKFKEI